MACEIAEIRILPPFAIARLGSASEPLDNYSLVVSDPVGPRSIVPAETIRFNSATGNWEKFLPDAPVSFRDDLGRVRPVAPFFEVWFRRAGATELRPLTSHDLDELHLKPSDVHWNVHLANHKIFRRTGDPRDRIEACTQVSSCFGTVELLGECDNFIKGKTIPLGHVRYLEPNCELPEIRLRFTPAAGRVYGPPLLGGVADPNLAGAVYDPRKSWKNYAEPNDGSKAPKNGRLLTNPFQTFAGSTGGDGSNRAHVSFGYFDDECDGFVEVKIGDLTAFARVAAGPPTFAPDSVPVRTVADEIEQAACGPDAADASPAECRSAAEDIVRRALETVRLMNTAQMNKSSVDRGVGMARVDAGKGRAPEAIFEPSIADSLAIRARHERVLLALESGSLAWFARALRDYNKTGDLSNAGRRKMPALMRGADGMHLALTRRQVSKIRKAAGDE